MKLATHPLQYTIDDRRVALWPQIRSEAVTKGKELAPQNTAQVLTNKAIKHLILFPFPGQNIFDKFFDEFGIIAHHKHFTACDWFV